MVVLLEDSSFTRWKNHFSVELEKASYSRMEVARSCQWTVHQWTEQRAQVALGLQESDMPAPPLGVLSRKDSTSLHRALMWIQIQKQIVGFKGPLAMIQVFLYRLSKQNEADAAKMMFVLYDAMDLHRYFGEDQNTTRANIQEEVALTVESINQFWPQLLETYAKWGVEYVLLRLVQRYLLTLLTCGYTESDSSAEQYAALLHHVFTQTGSSSSVRSKLRWTIACIIGRHADELCCASKVGKGVLVAATERLGCCLTVDDFLLALVTNVNYSSELSSYDFATAALAGVVGSALAYDVCVGGLGLTDSIGALSSCSVACRLATAVLSTAAGVGFATATFQANATHTRTEKVNNLMMAVVDETQYRLCPKVANLAIPDGDDTQESSHGSTDGEMEAEEDPGIEWFRGHD